MCEKSDTFRVCSSRLCTKAVAAQMESPTDILRDCRYWMARSTISLEMGKTVI